MLGKQRSLLQYYSCNKGCWVNSARYCNNVIVVTREAGLTALLLQYYSCNQEYWVNSARYCNVIVVTREAG